METFVCKNRSDKPWVTREVKQLIKKRHRLLNAYRKQRNPSVFVLLKTLGKDIKVKNKVAKEEYFLALGPKLQNNPKEMWKCLKTISKESVGIPTLKTVVYFLLMMSIKLLASIFISNHLSQLPARMNYRLFPTMCLNLCRNWS